MPTPIRAELVGREGHQRRYLEAIDAVTTRHAEVARKRPTGQDPPPTDEERAATLLKAARTSIDEANKGLEAWREANAGLNPQVEGAYKTLERAWAQLEKTQREVEKLVKAVADVEDELDRALVKKADKLTDRYEELAELLEPAFDDLDTALKRAQTDGRALEAEARALAPLLGDSPSWSKLDGAIPGLGERLDDLSPAPPKAMVDRLEAMDRALRWVKELKQDHEEIEEAVGAARKK